MGVNISKRPIVWHLSQVEFKTGTYISGALLNKLPYESSSKITVNALKVIGTYFTKYYKNASIDLKIGDRTVTVTTDKNGGFHYFVEATDLPKVIIFWNNEEITIEQEYPMFFKSAAPFTVISDIDDTAIRSYTASVIKRTLTTLFTTFDRRKVILFTSALAKVLEAKDASFHYVSKSESNLFGVLSSVFIQAKVPVGPLYLTPYLRLKELAKPKPGDHKYEAIKNIINRSPNTQFFLFGDDTQSDVKVYGRIIKEFPNRIASVYIHRTSLHLAGKRVRELDYLRSFGVRVVYFDNDQDPDDEIAWVKDYIS